MQNNCHQNKGKKGSHESSSMMSDEGDKALNRLAEQIRSKNSNLTNNNLMKIELFLT